MSQNDTITDSESFTFKAKITVRTHDNNIKDAEISVPLNLSNFWKTCECLKLFWNYYILTWSANFAISAATGASTFAIIDTKLYVPVVSL